MDADDSLTGAVIGAAYAVANNLGHGFLESVYRNALTVEMRHLGIAFEQEVPFPVFYRGEQVGQYRADLLVENEVLVELKVCDQLHASHTAQLLNYLAVSGHQTGLLINFGKPRIEVKRVSRSR